MKHIIIFLQALFFIQVIEIYIEVIYMCSLHYQYAFWRKNKKNREGPTVRTLKIGIPE